MGTHKPNMNAEPELVIERIFDAPRELVYKAWSEPRRSNSFCIAGIHWRSRNDSANWTRNQSLDRFAAALLID